MRDQPVWYIPWVCRHASILFIYFDLQDVKLRL